MTYKIKEALEMCRKTEIPIWEKANLTIVEAAKYSGSLDVHLYYMLVKRSW